MTRRDLPWILAALAAVWFYGECTARQRVADARLRERGQLTDSAAAMTDRRVAELAAREIATESTLARTGRALVVATREVARLRGRIVPVPDSGNWKPQVAARDSVIGRQHAIIVAQDSQLTIWKALAVERGAVLRDALQERDQYRAQRDAWRRQASKPNYAISDIGGGLIAGYGLAEKSDAAVLVGAATILLPRALHAIGRWLR